MNAGSNRREAGEEDACEGEGSASQYCRAKAVIQLGSNKKKKKAETDQPKKKRMRGHSKVSIGLSIRGGNLGGVGL